MSDLCSQVLVEVGDTIERLLRDVAGEHDDPTLLDVGCWDGELSARCGAALGPKRVLGIEVYEGPAVEAEAKGWRSPASTSKPVASPGRTAAPTSSSATRSSST